MGIVFKPLCACDFKHIFSIRICVRVDIFGEHQNIATKFYDPYTFIYLLDTFTLKYNQV